MFLRNKKKLRFIKKGGIDPDEVLLDAFNLPAFDTSQFEGRVEHPIHEKVPIIVGTIAMLILVIFLFQVWNLQVTKGEAMIILSQKNRIDKKVIFAERGIIYDRYNNELAWNVPKVDKNGEEVKEDFSMRKYSNQKGLAHVLGFVGYPMKDSNGFWWRPNYTGKAGVESSFSSVLSGKNGVRIIEVDALNNVQSKNTIQAPIDGKNIILSIDENLQEALFEAIKRGADSSGFVGGAGVIMDIKTGEVLALTSYPEYSSQVMTDGVDTKKIAQYNTDGKNVFLNRAVLGEYTPGSIVKPFVASAALSEGIISPSKKILSTGEIRVPNPYAPGKYSIFKDWRAQGWVDMVQAIAVSSNVYFYTIGGGFGGQEGLGIARLAAYAARFGLGAKTGIELNSEAKGVVPTPAWKREVFGDGNPWLLGDTYHTAIGQFGFLMTPIQAVRYIASVANGGTLVSPHLIKGTRTRGTSIGISDKNLSIVRKGMKQSVLVGVAAAVNISGIDISAKTGTAQLGKHNERMNSWVIGFWPASKPKFAFAVILENAPAHTLRGAAPAMRSFFEWMVRKQPEYVMGKYPSLK